jgi:hypothetical protein
MDEVNACHRRQRRNGRTGGQALPAQGRGARERPVLDGRRDRAVEDGPDTPIGGAPDDCWMTFDGARGGASTNAEAHLDKIMRLLKAAASICRQPEHEVRPARSADGCGAAARRRRMDERRPERTRVAVSVGPEVGNVSAMQVEDAIRRRQPQRLRRRGLRRLRLRRRCAGRHRERQPSEAAPAHGADPPRRGHGRSAQDQPGSQLFTVFSAPRVKGPTPGWRTASLPSRSRAWTSMTR